jgi:alginate O-acetyltransferase complex protein AlgI
MIFSSTFFLFLFLPVALGVYFILPRMLRNTWLLIMSLLFYAWGEKLFTLVLIGSMAINYLLGLLVGQFRSRRVSGWALAGSVAANLSVLVAYKYANFFVDSLNPVLRAWHFAPLSLKPVHLPIGISFFTFHAISYVVDVYRGHARAQRNPLNFALYESLFPQLIAGPIIRYQDIADQINDRRETLADFAYGVKRFVFGLAKKVLIANMLAVFADQIFATPADRLSASIAWFGAVCYALQIYFDFSGYSDMAIGLGRMFGFKFAENFNYPYISQSIQEFWRRWHISLSTWFRDYLYIPLGGNHFGRGRTYFNLLTVFCLCGLWHGASWNFLAWGLLHGLFLILERQKWMASMMASVWPALRRAYTLLVILTGWVLFRTNDIPEAWRYLRAMAGFGHGASVFALEIDHATLAALIAGVLCSMPVAARASHFFGEGRSSPLFEAFSGVARAAVLSALFLLCAIQLAAGTYNPFIYFRF